jgi:hypothetical protein
MSRKLTFILIALLVALGAAAAVAVEGEEVPLEEGVEGEGSVDEGMPPFLAEGYEGLPPGIAAKWSGDVTDVENLPYGLAKKLDPCLLPPGQAKKAVEAEPDDACGEESEGLDDLEESVDEGLPPFLSEDFEGELPPGIAAKWSGDVTDVEDLPYGLAKKLDPDSPHPGKGKKSDR